MWRREEAQLPLARLYGQHRLGEGFGRVGDGLRQSFLLLAIRLLPITQGVSDRLIVDRTGSTESKVVASWISSAT